MSPAVAWFWRAVALVLFAIVMAGVVWTLRQAVGTMPDMLLALVAGLLFGGSVGFLIGADFGRKQERRPSSAPR